MLPTNGGHAKRDVMCADPSPRLAEDQGLMHPQAGEPGRLSLGEDIIVNRGLPCVIDGGASPKDSPRPFMSGLVPSVYGSSEHYSGCHVSFNPSGNRGASGWKGPIPSILKTVSCCPLHNSCLLRFKERV